MKKIILLTFLSAVIIIVGARLSYAEVPYVGQDDRGQNPPPSDRDVYIGQDDRGQDYTATEQQRGQDYNGKLVPIKSPLNSDIKSVGDLVNKFVEIFSYLAIIFAVLMIVWTGFQMILARGKPDKLTENGKRLGAILIGVAIVIGARVMISVIINTLEATGTVTPNTINQIRSANQQ